MKNISRDKVLKLRKNSNLSIAFLKRPVFLYIRPAACYKERSKALSLTIFNIFP